MKAILFAFLLLSGILTFNVLALPDVGQSQSLATVGDLKTIVFLARYLDSPDPPPFTPEQVQEAIFQGALAGYIPEASYGLASVSGKVSGWQTLQRNALEEGDLRCYLPQISDVKDMAAKEGVNLLDYDTVVVLNLCPNFGGIGGAAGGGFAKVNVWEKSLNFHTAFPFPLRMMDRTLMHEYGHELGLGHAGMWQCEEGVSLHGSQCTLIEYGNLFDVMGRGAYGLHVNAYDKNAMLAWIDESSVLTVGESGTYSLAPLEGGSGARLARIQTKDGMRTPFFIEYRRAIGFDGRLADAASASNERGIFVYWHKPEIHARELLLDMSPDRNLSRVTLNVGEGSFSDPGTGIIIGPVHSANAESVRFDVTVGQPECVRGAPFSLSGIFPTRPLVQAMNPGSSTFFRFSVASGDSFICGPAEVVVAIQSPPGIEVSTLTSGWKNSLLEVLSVGALEKREFFFNARVLSQTPVGEYPIAVTLTNQASGLSLQGNVILKVTTPPLSVDLKAAELGGIATDGPLSIPFDTEAVLSWDTTNATLCSLSWKEFQGAEGVDSTVGVDASVSTGRLIADRIYELRCLDPSLEYAKSDTVEIKVEGASSEPAIITTIPNGGETWEVGAKHKITWKSRGISTVNIDLLKGAAFLQQIAVNHQNSEEFEWTPPPLLPGNDFRIQVSDATNPVVSDRSDEAFALKQPGKAGGNTAPEILVEEEISGMVNELLLAKLSATDVDGDALTVQATGLPQGASVVPLGDVNLDGAVNAFDVQLFLQFRTGLAWLNEFQLAVADANEDGVVNVQDSVVVSQLAGGVVPITKYRLVWQPSNAQAGLHEVKFMANDGKELVQKTTTILVQIPNLPPILNVEREHAVEAGKLLVAPVSAFDHENDILAFAAENLPSGAYFTALGDANLDGTLNAFDAILVQQFIAESVSPTSLQLAVADVNGDDEVNGADLALLDQLIEGIVPATEYRLLWQTLTTDVGEYAVSISVSDGSLFTRETMNIRVRESALQPLEVSIDRLHMFQDNPELLHVRGTGIEAGGTFFFRFTQGDFSSDAFVFEAKEDAELEIDFASKKEELESLVPGLYDIEIERGANSAMVTVKDFLVTKRGDLPGQDGKRDAKIDIFDVSHMIPHFGSALGNAAYASDFDINVGPNNVSKDKVDLYDANLLMVNWTGS